MDRVGIILMFILQFFHETWINRPFPIYTLLIVSQNYYTIANASRNNSNTLIFAAI